MLLHNLEQISKGIVTVKDFSFPVNNILLQVKSNRLGNAEILHSFGNSNSYLLANSKEMVHCSFAGKNNSGVVQNVNFLLPKFLRRNTLYMNKGSEINLQTILLS